MVNHETIKTAVEGMAYGEAFIEDVYHPGEDMHVPIDEAWEWAHARYMQESWELYTKEWFDKNEELIAEALAEYDHHETGAWGLGVDIAHTVLESGVSFRDREFLDAELADRLEDSLDDFRAIDGLHEYWITDEGNLGVGRWN